MKYLTKNIKAIAASLAVCLSLVSCQEDDTLARRGKPGVTVTQNTVTVVEGETAVFDFTLDYAVQNKLDIRIEPLDANGNAIPVTEPNGDPNSGNGYGRLDFEDFNVPYATWFQAGWFQYGYLGGTGYVASYPAYSETFQIEIETIRDLMPENTKSYSFRLSATSLMEVVIDEVITVNIDNYTSDELVTRLAWAGDYIPGVDVCDLNNGLDLDLELYFEGGFTDFSYGDCPEEITVAANALDGNYTIDASVWTVNGNSTPDNINIPATITFIKPGIFYEEVSLATLFPLNDGGLNDGNANAITTFTIVKSGTNYTITDSNNAQVASGRNADFRISLEEKIALKNQL